MSDAAGLGLTGQTSVKRFRVVLHRAAVDEIQSLPAKTKEKVKLAIDQLADDPRPTTAAKLKGRPNAYRIRFGDYRLLYEVNATEILVYVIGVSHRREVYQRLLRRK